MTDVVVTCPKGFWPEWIEEGDAAGEDPTGAEWDFGMGGRIPTIEPGERVYVVAWGRLRGYAPLVELRAHRRGTITSFSLRRKADAVAVTVPVGIKGFQGWRYRWWDRDVEVPFPDWMTEGIPPQFHPNLGPERRRIA